MADYALVQNAGSSSLNFSVYERIDAQDWRLSSRVQIEGIGTSPRIAIKNADGRIRWWAKCGMAMRRRIPLPAGFDTRSAVQLLGFGHWIVHGDSRYADWVLVIHAVLTELRLVPFVPLHQTHNLAGIEQVFERMPEGQQARAGCLQ